MKITHLWIVTKPTAVSEMIDIVSLVELKEELKFQFLGGMKSEDIIGFYTEEAEAVQIADKALKKVKKEGK